MNAATCCHTIEGCPGLYVDAFRGQLLRRTSDTNNSFVLTHYHGVSLPVYTMHIFMYSEDFSTPHLLVKSAFTEAEGDCGSSTHCYETICTLRSHVPLIHHTQTHPHPHARTHIVCTYIHNRTTMEIFSVIRSTKDPP